MPAVVFIPKVEGNIEERLGEEAKLLNDDWWVDMEVRLQSSSSPIAQDVKEPPFRPVFCGLPRVPGHDDCRLMDVACCLCTNTIFSPRFGCAFRNDFNNSRRLGSTNFEC